jgi:predicted Zn-dependent protease
MIAELYLSLDDLPKARELAERTIVLQPDLPTAHIALANIDAFEGRAADAKKRCQELMSMFPNESTPLAVAGQTYFWLRDFKGATPLLEKELSLTAPESDSYNPLAYIYLKAGRKQEAERLLNQCIAQQHKYIDKGDEGYGSRFAIATSYAVQGNDEEALRWLQEALDRGLIDWRLINGHPAYDHLRTNARFKQMMDDLRLKIDRMRKHAEELDRQ